MALRPSLSSAMTKSTSLRRTLLSCFCNCPLWLNDEPGCGDLLGLGARASETGGNTPLRRQATEFQKLILAMGFVISEATVRTRRQARASDSNQAREP